MPVVNQLLHTPAHVAQRVLIDLALGTAPADAGSWPIFESSEPSAADAPDNCLTVYDTQGRDDGSNMITGEQSHHRGVQVRVRSSDKVTGAAKAEEAAVVMAQSAVDRIATIDGTRYLLRCFSDVGQPISLGTEPGTKRRAWTVNALVVVEVWP